MAQHADLVKYVCVVTTERDEWLAHRATTHADWTLFILFSLAITLTATVTGATAQTQHCRARRAATVVATRCRSGRGGKNGIGKREQATHTLIRCR